MNYKSYLAALMIFLGVFNGKAQQTIHPTDYENLQLDSKVRYGKLDNGFTYYLRDTGSEITELRMVVKAGTYHQDEDQSEYAHLLEHMVFKDPKNFPNENKYFTTGGRYKHARTESENTYYYAQIPSNDKEGIQNGLQLLRDWAQDVEFEEKSIDVERGAVLGEMRVLDSYQLWWRNQLEGQLVKNTSFKLPKLNKSKANMQNFNSKAFTKFYIDWYRPDLEAAIVVGDIDLDSTVTQIKRLFSDLNTPKIQRDAGAKVESMRIELSGKNQVSKIIDTLKRDLRLYVITKRLDPTYNPKTEDDFRDLLLQKLYDIIIGTRSKWLAQQYHPPFSNFTNNFGAGNSSGSQLHSSMMTVDLKEGNTELIYDQIQNSLVAWRQLHSGWSNLELEKAKEKLKSQLSLEEMNTSSSLADDYMLHYVRGNAAPSPELKQKVLLEFLDRISLREMENFTNDYGDLSINTDYVFFTDGDMPIPDKIVMERWWKRIRKLKVKPLSPPEINIVSLTEEVEPHQENIEIIASETKNLIGVSTITLKNGIKLILKPSQPQSGAFFNRVSISAYKPNNIPLENKQEYLLASVAPEVVKFLGAGSYSKFELDYFMQQNGMEFSLNLNKDFYEINASSSVAHLDELLNLILLYATKPRNDKEAFEVWKDQKLKILSETAPRGTSEFYMDDLKALWFPQVPQLEKKDLEKMTVQNILENYEKRFSDFDDFKFIITGDFKEEELKTMLPKILSAFPVGSNTHSEDKPSFKFPLEKMNKVIRIKNSNQAFISLYFPVFAPADIKTQASLNLLVKGLNKRIWDRLREGCYAPRATGDWMDRKNGIYAFEIHFDSELGQEKNLIKYALEEFELFRENGINSEWFETVRVDEKVSFGKRLESFGYFNFWPVHLQQSLHNDEDPQKMVFQYESILDHFINLKEVDEAAKKYLSIKNLQKFTVLPEDYREN